MKSSALKKLNDELKATEGKLAELIPKRFKLSKKLNSRMNDINEKSKMLEELNSEIIINETRASKLRSETSKEEARAAHLDQERQRIIDQKFNKEEQLRNLESESNL